VKPHLDHPVDPRLALGILAVLALGLFYMAYSIRSDVTTAGGGDTPDATTVGGGDDKPADTTKAPDTTPAPTTPAPPAGPTIIVSGVEWEIKALAEFLSDLTREVSGMYKVLGVERFGWKDDPAAMKAVSDNIKGMMPTSAYAKDRDDMAAKGASPTLAEIKASFGSHKYKIITVTGEIVDRIDQPVEDTLYGWYATVLDARGDYWITCGLSEGRPNKDIAKGNTVRFCGILVGDAPWKWKAGAVECEGGFLICGANYKP